MKDGKRYIDSCLKRGWVRMGNRLYTPAEATRMNIKPDKAKRQPKAKRTGWVDDDLNIRNRQKYTDIFIRLIKLELDLEVWPEFYFTTEKQYRFDYAIPVIANYPKLKIALEVDGGIWMKGGGAHSRPQNIERDMEKSTLANINGWTLIRCTPAEIKNEPGKIIRQIEQIIRNNDQNSHTNSVTKV